ncbi:MAG: DNRLRE domain-containing protein, partial [Dehalococcoidia bacterium]|nr:DNRLRE domain-containing protein [Dehalococcoidia bacterium]
MYKTYATKDSFMSATPASEKSINYGALTVVEHGIDYAGPDKSVWRRALGNFDVAPLSGRTINSAKLVRRMVFIAGSPVSARVSRCTRPADWVESEVTWLNYKSGSAWTAGGGDYDDVTPVKVDYTEASGNGEHEITGLAAFVTDALNNRSGIVSVIMRLVEESPGVDQYYQWRAKEYGGRDRWRLVVDHSGAPIG